MTAQVVAIDGQPQIDKSLSQLASRFDQDGLLVDLYGTNSKHGIEVADVALHGSTVSLASAYSERQMDEMGECLERLAKRDARQRRTDNAIDQAYLAMHGKRV